MGVIVGFALAAGPAIADVGGVGSVAGVGSEISRALFTYQLMLAVSLLVGIAAGVASIIGVLGMARARKDVQKREVSFAQEYVPRGECDLRSQAAEERLVRFERELMEIRAAAGLAARGEEDRVTRIHQRLDAMEQKISDMPSQIVALLRNTGAIRHRDQT